MVKRLIFATIVTTIFLTSLLAGWLKMWAILIGVLVPLVLTVVVSFMREEEAETAGEILGFFLRTSNRWLVTMVAMTIISFGLAVATPYGAPHLLKEAERSKQEEPLKKILEEREKTYNLYFHNEDKTDQELGLTQPKPESWSRSWKPYLMRWICSYLLLILTIGYALFALTDKMERAYHATERHFLEHESGDTARQSLIRRLIQRLLGITEIHTPPAPTRGAIPPTGTTGTGGTNPEVASTTTHALGGSWLGIFFVTLLIEILGEGLGERIFGGRRLTI